MSCTFPSSALKDVDGEVYIAGNNSRADWQALRAQLKPGEAAGWDAAFTEYYEQRLELRYLHPIKILREHGTSVGEGFAIAAIQCSLIEFLESTEQGINYSYTKPGPHEYNGSQDVFVSFLTRREPFKSYFDQAAAVDFYRSVRCGLLHEARTKNTWRIWASALDGQIVDVAKRILDRNNFQDALLTYIHEFGVRLRNDPDLQAAFLRKFDTL